MARQPFYHRCDVVFLGNDLLSRNAIELFLEKGMGSVEGYVRRSAEVETVEHSKPNGAQFLQVATILFTATRDLTSIEIREALLKTLGKSHGVTGESLQIEHFEEPEPGDPCDL